MPEQKHDWKEVVEMKPRGYFEWQDQEAGIVTHGPVKSIWVDEADTVTIQLEWVAQMGLPGREGFGKWVKSDPKNLIFPFPNLIVPYQIESIPERGDRVQFAGYGLMYINPQPDSDERIFKAITDSSES